MTHTLAAQTFYHGAESHALEIRPVSAYLAGHADGIEDTAAAKQLSDRHAGWAADMPQNIAELWGFIAGLDQASLIALFAHCASLTVNAVKQPWENKPQAHVTVNRLASALGLDMSQHWTPTIRSYLGRVTKAHILAAVREAAGDEAAERIAGMKKQAMAEAAEGLLGETDWLPPLLRTEQPASTPAEGQASEAESDAVDMEEGGMASGDVVFSEAAE